MPVSFANLIVGAQYDRPQLAKLWGYKGYQALAKGIVTPADTPYIILFVTEEKQSFQTQYHDRLENDILYMEGETSHTTDQRIVRAAEKGDEIHLFYRKQHHTDFLYCGRVSLNDYTLNTSKPSSFVFSIGDKATLMDEFDRSFSRRQSSYKMVAILETRKSDGIADVDEMAGRFAAFYRVRNNRNLKVENDDLSMAKIDGMLPNKIKLVMLSNPVVYLREFLEYNKAGNTVVFKKHILDSLNTATIKVIQSIAYKHLNDYYSAFGGLGFTKDELLAVFKERPDFVTGQETKQVTIYALNSEPEPKKNLVLNNSSLENNADVVDESASMVERTITSAFLSLCDYNKKLVDRFIDLKFFGENELEQEEVEKLGRLIRSCLGDDLAHGIKMITEKAPMAMAVYLVGSGIYNYREGDFWSSLADSIGVKDANVQNLIGSWFVNYLEESDKLVLKLPESHINVANILLHGGIPQYCLPGYFEHVVQYFVAEDLVEPENVRTRLSEWRNQEKSYFDMETHITTLNNECSQLGGKLEKVKRLIMAREDFRQMKELPLKDRDIFEELGADYSCDQREREAELIEINAKLQALIRDKEEYHKAINDFIFLYPQFDSSIKIVQDFIALYESSKEVISALEILKADKTAAIAKINILSERLFGRQTKETLEKDIIRLPFEKLAACLKKGSELQAILAKKTIALSSSGDKPVTSAAMLMLGLLLAAVGIALILINPVSLINWLPGVLGIATVVPGWKRYLASKEVVAKQRNEKEALVKEVEALKSQYMECMAMVETISGGLLSNERLSASPPLYELAALVEQLHEATIELIGSNEKLKQILMKLEPLKQSYFESKRILNCNTYDKKGLEELLPLAQAFVSEALNKQKEALYAEEKINEINRRISFLESEEKRLQGLITDTNDALTSIGEGDLDHGSSIVAKYFTNLQCINELEEELARGEWLDINKIVSDDSSALQTLQEDLEKSIQKSGLEAARLEKNLAVLDRPLPYLDEPVRRFLLYGEQWADWWVQESIRMYVEIRTGKSFNPNREKPLPLRLIEAFNSWHAGQKKVEAEPLLPQAPSRQRFTTPEIKLVPTGELCLYFPLQRFYSVDDATECWLNICSIEDGRLIHRAQLPVYRCSDNLLETEAIAVPIIEIAEIVEVTIDFGENVLQAWRFKILVADGLPVVVFDENGKLVCSEPLPREKLWFILHSDLAVRSKVSILEEGITHLVGHYFMQLIDLSQLNADRLCIDDKQGRQYYLTLCREQMAAPFFIGNIIDGVSVDESYALYRRNSMEFHIPSVELSELNLWVVQIRPRAGFPGKEASWNLGELDDILRYQHNISKAILPLEQTGLFATETCGRYTLTCINPQKEVFRFDINFVEKFESVFSPKLCPPYEGQSELINLKVLCSETLDFRVTTPVKLISKENAHYVFQLKCTEEKITCTVSWVNANGYKIELPLFIEVPKVRWRLHGSEAIETIIWNDNIHELWFGDWQAAEMLTLYIAVPSYFKGKARISLDGTGQYYEGEIKNGLVKFNMLPFIDALKSDEELRSFSLSLFDYSINELVFESLLFRVRTRWTVEDFYFVERAKDGKNSMQLRWLDRGNMNNRVLRFWDKMKPYNDPILEVSIHDDVSELFLESTIFEKLHPGAYFAEFGIEDLWDATAATFPLKKKHNVFSCQITGSQIMISDCFVEWVNGSAKVQGNLSNGSLIQIDVFLIGRRKEKWLQQIVSTKTDEDGFFSVTVDADQDYAHWVGVVTQKEPRAYLFSILPRSAPLYFLLNKANATVFKLSQMDPAKLKIFDADDIGFRYPFEIVDDSKVKKTLAGGHKESELQLKMSDGSVQKAKLEMNHAQNAYKLKLEKGVKCTGKNCIEKNRIFPNQKAWYKHSSRLESPTCKSMETNFVETDAVMVIAWDLQPYLAKLASLCPWLGSLRLFSNTGPILEEGVRQYYSDPLALPEKLLTREMELIAQLLHKGWLDN